MALLKKCIILKDVLLPYTRHLLSITETRNIARWVAPTLKEFKKRRESIGLEPERPRSTYLDWNYDAELYAFGPRLNESFNLDLLRTALIHKSFSQKSSNVESNESIKDNSMLIQQGEDLICSFLDKYLDKKLDGFPEEGRRATRNHLMSEKCLSLVARHIGLKDIILCGEFPVSDATLASSFKAVVAALVNSTDKDRGEKFVRDMLIAQLGSQLDALDIWLGSELLETAQERLHRELKARGEPPPEARLCEASATNTILAAYRIGLYNTKRKLLGAGWGETVDEATRVAAADALRRLWSQTTIT